MSLAGKPSKTFNAGLVPAFVQMTQSTTTQGSQLMNLSRELRSIAQREWEKQKNLPLSEREIFGDPEARSRVVEIGKKANESGGFIYMETVYQIAFMPRGVYETQLDSRAVQELNYVWSGIGDWLA